MLGGAPTGGTRIGQDAGRLAELACVCKLARLTSCARREEDETTFDAVDARWGEPRRGKWRGFHPCRSARQGAAPVCDLPVNGGWNQHLLIKIPEQVQVSDCGEADQGGGIADDDHSLPRRRSVARSASNSRVS
jgi:hypothetical protein